MNAIELVFPSEPVEYMAEHYESAHPDWKRFRDYQLREYCKLKPAPHPSQYDDMQVWRYLHIQWMTEWKKHVVELFMTYANAEVVEATSAAENMVHVRLKSGVCYFLR
jgi:hypothetical protein